MATPQKKQVAKPVKKPADKEMLKTADDVPVTGAETLPDETAPDPFISQRKVSRGSRRRILRALDKFDAAVKEVCTELNLQLFEAGADGQRVGKWGLVAATEEIPTQIRAEVMTVLNQD